MNSSVRHPFCICLIVLFGAFYAFPAQGQWLKKSGRALLTKEPTASARLIRIPPSFDRSFQQAAQTARTPTWPLVPNASVLPQGAGFFLPARTVLPSEQKELNRAVREAAKQRRISLSQARKWLAEHPAQAARAFGLPIFTDRAYLFRDFRDAQPSPFDVWPPYPVGLHAKDVYRGMAFSADAEDFRTLLTRGLLTEKTGLYAGEHLIFLSADLQTALSHADLHFRTPSKRLGVPVLVHAQGFPPQRYVSSARDIGPKHILRVSVLLAADGEAAWGALSLLPDGTFLFRPYKVPEEQKNLFKQMNWAAGY